MTKSLEFNVDTTIGATLIPTLYDNDDVVKDLSSCTEILFKFQKPDGSVVEKTGGFNTNGVDGKCLYTFVAGDLDQTGVWYYWLKLTSPTFIVATNERKPFSVR